MVSALRERMIAHLPRWAPRAAAMPWLANLRDTLPGAKTLAEKWLGFSARRSLPRWRRDTFLRAGAPANTRDDDADVVLFVDTFTNYFEPENARAAVAVLRAGGFSRPRCARWCRRCRTFAAAVLWPHVSGGGTGRRGHARGTPRHRRAGAACRARRPRRRSRALVPLHAARRVPGDGVRRRRAAPGRALPD